MYFIREKLGGAVELVGGITTAQRNSGNNHHGSSSSNLSVPAGTFRVYYSGGSVGYDGSFNGSYYATFNGSSVSNGQYITGPGTLTIVAYTTSGFATVATVIASVCYCGIPAK